MPACPCFQKTDTEGKGVTLGLDLQKANMWKRIAAWLLDGMLTCVVAVGFIAALSAMLGYESHNSALQAAYNRYETQYGVQFNLTQPEYEALSQQELDAYQQAYEALVADDEVLYEYNMVVNLSLVITTVGILLGVLCIEFVVPLLLKNGQTLGKKVFGIALVRQDCVRVTVLQLFIRALLGKYTVETMIPVYMFLMFIWGMLDMTGLIVLAALLIAQLCCLAVTRNNSAIHDLLAGTVTVDLPSQRIFRSTDELIAYTKQVHAERAAQQDY